MLIIGSNWLLFGITTADGIWIMYVVIEWLSMGKILRVELCGDVGVVVVGNHTNHDIARSCRVMAILLRGLLFGA